MQPRKVVIIIFDNVEVLDFCGPFEVFGVARDADNQPLFEVFTVAEEDRPIYARNGLIVHPNYTFATCPKPDLYLVPGGQGVRKEVDNPIMIDWIKDQATHSELVLSVCTGAWMLAKAGLLQNLSATTYHTAFERLLEIEPTLTVNRDVRWVDNGRIVTSAGVSAGIDMALHVVAKLHGEDIALKTARHMEYEYYKGEVRDNRL